jgi:hypothetical protein
MSIADRLYRAALRAYPSDYRRERGPEILTTIGDGGSEVRVRELWALVRGGLHQRGRSAGGDTRAGAWASGNRLGALVVLLLTAAASLYPLVWEVWYVRLGMRWPLGQAGVTLVSAPRDYLTQQLMLFVLALISAIALCRGRLRIAIAASAIAAMLYVLGFPHVGFGSLGFGFADATSLARLRDSVGLACRAAFYTVPAVLLWSSRGGRPHRHSLAWLLLPLTLGALSLAFYTSTITFWTIGMLAAAWVVCSRVDPRLGVAALALSISASLYLVPVIIFQPNSTSAGAVALGAAMLAAVALASVLRPRVPA